MKTLSIGTISVGVIAVAALAVIAIGTPGTRKAAPPAPRAASSPQAVSNGGFTLASTSVALPVDDQHYPAGPHADVVNANCLACHSASMVLNQPSLTPDQWKAEVTKMREVYKAPIAEQDVPAIVAYLTSLGAPKASVGSADPADGAGTTG